MNQKIAVAHNKIIVVTLAAEGSLVFDSSRTFSEPAAPVTAVVDTTGSEDSFAAGFLSPYCAYWNIQEEMASGAICAAQTIGRIGY